LKKSATSPILDFFSCRQTKKLIFNEKHNLKIKNYPVEVYPQPMEKPDASEGKYSLLKDEWVIVRKYGIHFNKNRRLSLI